MCAFPGDGLFSWGGSSLGLVTDCSLSALPCAFAAFLSEPFRVSGGPRRAPEPALWGGRVLTSPDGHSISRDESAKVSVGPTLAHFMIFMSVNYPNRILCLKKDYFAGSCLPNINLEQGFTAEMQWPDSNIYDRNSDTGHLATGRLCCQNGSSYCKWEYVQGILLGASMSTGSGMVSG